LGGGCGGGWDGIYQVPLIAGPEHTKVQLSVERGASRERVDLTLIRVKRGVRPSPLSLPLPPSRARRGEVVCAAGMLEARRVDGGGGNRGLQANAVGVERREGRGARAVETLASAALAAATACARQPLERVRLCCAIGAWREAG
jgi:hypothetical protein